MVDGVRLADLPATKIFRMNIPRNRQGIKVEMRLRWVLGWRLRLCSAYVVGKDKVMTMIMGKIIAETPLDFMYFLRFDLTSVLCVEKSRGRRINFDESSTQRRDLVKPTSL
ncbi:MAG: hypothetical protein DA443_06070 [Bacteroidetes bacterium]|nr:MAG: hypothetical protein DA443_06070 [Bacteroidota bacterium]